MYLLQIEIDFLLLLKVHYLESEKGYVFLRLSTKTSFFKIEQNSLFHFLLFWNRQCLLTIV